MKCVRSLAVRVGRIALALLCGEAAIASDAVAPVSATHRAMGTEFVLTVYPPDGDSTADANRLAAAARLHTVSTEVFAEIDLIEDLLTTWRSESQVSYVNRHAAEGPVRVNVDVFEVLVASQTYYSQTNGAFDPTVGPLSRLYGLYDEEGRLPTKADVADVMPRIGMNFVKIDRQARTVSFHRPGIELDFGGIGKGYAVDKAVEIIQRHGVTRALVDAGSSSIVALGAPPGERGWTVRVRDPYNSANTLAKVVLNGESLSTSGCYDLDKVDGTPICNIFDPRTGRPKTGMLSATVIGLTATYTDALSTGFLVMGVDETRAFCKEHPEIRAILVPEPPDGDPVPIWIGDGEAPWENGSTK
jgi:thiamine biosynthesis lipoprotein